ncbi:hypothetical protein ACFE04_020529 [Oxalis oulophora]
MKLSSLFSCFSSQTEDTHQTIQGGQSQIHLGFTVFTYNDLKNATSGFSNKIGEGAFGSVFKVWEAYNGSNAKPLVELIDFTLENNFPEEEALLFLKVGLLCVQETARLRPKMSMALKMLNNEIDISDVKILQPGLVDDLMNIKLRQTNSSQSTTNSKDSSSLSMSSPHPSSF